MNIKISVIVPVYNAEKYLNECLDSIINQTLKDIEIICVNDGSTDNSLSILKSYAEKDKRVVVIDQKNSGAPVARNKALKAARGEYIGFVDSDDWIETNFYEVLYNEAKKQNADLARTSYRYVYPDRMTEDSINKLLANRKNAKSLLNVNDHSVVIWNAIYRTKYLRKNRIDYFDNIKGSHDVPFTARATFHSKKSIPVLGTFYNYRKEVVNQISNLTIDRVQWVRKTNRITLDFIQKSNYSDKNDYLAAFKRCMWRYDDIFTRALSIQEFNVSRQKEFFSDFTEQFNKCKYLQDLLQSNEKYYTYLANNNFPAYISLKGNKMLDKLIVSLTSYPARIGTVNKTIETLLAQTYMPEFVVLWLAEEQFPGKEKDLPEELLSCVDKGLKISWCNDVKSFKKLVPAIKAYPGYIIVTADDDLYYPKDWLEKLYLAYVKTPNMIHCHRARKIIFNNKKIAPYKDWSLCKNKVASSYNNFFTGVGGVLYPPDILHKNVLNENEFTQLCPHADDLWFWAMAVLNNVKINVVHDNMQTLKYVEGTQEESLYHENLYNGRNDTQIDMVLKKYPELLKKLDKNRPGKVNFIHNIFSIRNEGNHKVFRMLGLKIKFKNKKHLDYMPLADYIFSVKKEDNHDIIRILGCKIKLRNSKHADYIPFIQYIFSIRNEEYYKVIRIFGSKMKFRNKYKEFKEHATKLTSHTTELKSHATELKKYAENIVFQNTELKGHATELTDYTKEVMHQSAELLEHAAGLKENTAELKDYAKEVMQQNADLTDHAIELKDYTKETVRQNAELLGHTTELKRHTTEIKDYTKETARQSAELLGQTTELKSHTAEIKDYTREAVRQSAELVEYATELKGNTTEIKDYAKEAVRQNTELVVHTTELKDYAKDALRQNTELVVHTTELKDYSKEAVRQNTELVVHATELKDYAKETARQNIELVQHTAELKDYVKETARQNTELVVHTTEIKDYAKETARQNTELVKHTTELKDYAKETARQNTELVEHTTELKDYTKELVRQNAELTSQNIELIKQFTTLNKVISEQNNHFDNLIQQNMNTHNQTNAEIMFQFAELNKAVSEQNNHVEDLIQQNINIKNQIKVNFKAFYNLTDTIRKNIQKLPIDYDLIVGIPRSGIIPAYVIALFLNKNVCSLNEFVMGMIPGKGERLVDENGEIKKILVVDDSAYAGASLQKTRKTLKPFSKNYSIDYMAVYVREESIDFVDYFFEVVSMPRLFQWNYLNHSIAGVCCYDMDGVLCVDPTDEQNDDGDKYIDFILNAKPLYIPSYTIHSIVTSRLEKYRPQTEEWLKKHNVKYKNLYMMNVETAEERRKLGNHAKFKADIYMNLKDTVCFIESEPKQARTIAELSGKQCICVSTDEYFEF